MNKYFSNIRRWWNAYKIVSDAKTRGYNKSREFWIWINRGVNTIFFGGNPEKTLSLKFQLGKHFIFRAISFMINWTVHGGADVDNRYGDRLPRDSLALPWWSQVLVISFWVSVITSIIILYGKITWLY